MTSFNDLQWLPDRMILKDFVFRLEHLKGGTWDLGDECFTFYKVKELVDEYQNFFQKNKDFRADTIYELGVFGGGSVAFWNELLNPVKHIGIDINPKKENVYLETYFNERRALGKTVEIFGEVNQADKKKLLTLHRTIFNSPLDLVIDDASHFLQ